MRFGKFILTFVVLLVFSGCNVSDGISNDDPYQDAPTNIDKDKLVRLVNDARAVGRYCGDEFFPAVGKIVWSDLVEKAAKNHSDDMNKNSFFDHTGSDGSSAGDRLHEVGYKWSTYGENIAKGYPTEESVIEGWLNSSGHCANIMNKNFTEMGVAATIDYWTQVFAKPIL